MIDIIISVSYFQIVCLRAALIDRLTLGARGDSGDAVAFGEFGMHADGVIGEHLVRVKIHLTHLPEIDRIGAVISQCRLGTVDLEGNVIVPCVVERRVVGGSRRQIEHVRGDRIVRPTNERDVAECKVPAACTVCKLDVLNSEIGPVLHLGKTVAKGTRLIAVADLRERNVHGTVRSDRNIELSADIVLSAVGNAYGADLVRQCVHKGKAEIFLACAPHGIVSRKLDAYIAEPRRVIGAVCLAINDLETERKIGGIRKRIIIAAFRCRRKPHRARAFCRRDPRDHAVLDGKLFKFVLRHGGCSRNIFARGGGTHKHHTPPQQRSQQAQCGKACDKRPAQCLCHSFFLLIFSYFSALWKLSP